MSAVLSVVEERPRDGVLIASSFGREAWAKDCSASIPVPHIVVVGDGYELGKIAWAMENTTWDRVVFIQDSVIITDPSLFDRIAQTPGSICLNDSGDHFTGYSGVYERHVLARVGTPETPSKRRSLDCEFRWTKNYMDWATHLSTFSCWGHATPQSTTTTERHGRLNRTYSTAYFTKYQGYWAQAPVEQFE